jgi:hypothetical protein
VLLDSPWVLTPAQHHRFWVCFREFEGISGAFTAAQDRLALAQRLCGRFGLFEAAVEAEELTVGLGPAGVGLDGVLEQGGGLAVGGCVPGGALQQGLGPKAGVGGAGALDREAATGQGRRCVGRAGQDHHQLAGVLALFEVRRCEVVAFAIDGVDEVQAGRCALALGGWGVGGPAGEDDGVLDLTAIDRGDQGEAGVEGRDHLGGGAGEDEAIKTASVEFVLQVEEVAAIAVHRQLSCDLGGGGLGAQDAQHHRRAGGEAGGARLLVAVRCGEFCSALLRDGRWAAAGAECQQQPDVVDHGPQQAVG